MPRRRPDDAVKQRMWDALWKAAKRHHNYPRDRGMNKKIATDAGVSRTAVTDWKKLRNYPEEETLLRLADLYGVSAEVLSGYIEGDVLGEDFGPPDKMLHRSVELTRKIIKRLVPNPSLEDYVRVSTRVNELMVQGRSDEAIKGLLLDELSDDEPDSD